MVATTGGSSRKPSAVAILEVDSMDDLLKAEPDQWQMIRLSTKSQVSRMTVEQHVSYSLSSPCVVNHQVATKETNIFILRQAASPFGKRC